MYIGNKKMGDTLTDNSYIEDGYRYHDVFHLAYAAILGWSPVLRKILSVKRKSNKTIDEVEDGARAAIIEELISALIYQNAKDHKNYNGLKIIDHHLLKTIRSVVIGLEVGVCTISEWQNAILQGYEVFRLLNKNKGGTVSVSLNKREIKYLNK